MPIRREHRFLYPIDWPQISRRVRFQRAGGRCEACGRPHGARVRQLPDGRWLDPEAAAWHDDAGRAVPGPDLVELVAAAERRVVLAACCRDHEPWRIGDADLAAWCGRCHLRHGRGEHARRRRLAALRRRALGDLFLGRYPLTWRGAAGPAPTGAGASSLSAGAAPTALGNPSSRCRSAMAMAGDGR